LGAFEDGAIDAEAHEVALLLEAEVEVLSGVVPVTVEDETAGALFDGGVVFGYAFAVEPV